MSDPPDSLRPVVVHAPVAVLGAGTQRVTHGQEEAEERKEKATPSVVEDASNVTTLLMQMMAQMERMQVTQRRQDEQMERFSTLLTQSNAGEQHQLMNELLEERHSNIAADTLRTPISTSVKRFIPPAAQRGLHMPSDPGSPRNTQQQGDGRSNMPVGVGGLQFKDILSLVPKNVTPFYGDTTKDDNTTVLMFVLNVESVMGNLLMDGRSPHRLMLVQLCLRGGALAWMERKLHELTEAEKHWRDFDAKPLNWDDDLRRPFIQAHLGSNTPQLWLAKLKTLVLGENDTPTPIELDNQFDMIAQHVFPMRIAGDERSELLLATYYGEIVAHSHKWLYTNIVRGNGVPNTLKKWKEALANAWNAEAHIKAMTATKPARTAVDDKKVITNRRGGHERGGGQSSALSQPVRAAAMNAQDGAGTEGQQSTEDNNDTQQLNAAAGGNREVWSEDKQRRYRDKQCFHCGAPYDKATGCSKKCRIQAPKAKAGQ